MGGRSDQDGDDAVEAEKEEALPVPTEDVLNPESVLNFNKCRSDQDGGDAKEDEEKEEALRAKEEEEEDVPEAQHEEQVMAVFRALPRVGSVGLVGSVGCRLLVQ